MIQRIKSIRRRGFTIIELLVVVAITTVGFVAVLNLQIGTLHGAAAARDQQMAVQLAQSVGSTIRLEGLNWVEGVSTTTLNGTSFILNAPTDTTAGQTSGWLVAWAAGGGTDLQVGPAGADPTWDLGANEALGARNIAGESINRHFCVHYRLTWVISDQLLRGDVRIMWPRRRGALTTYTLCPIGMEQRLEDISTLTMPVTIPRNVFLVNQ